MTFLRSRRSPRSETQPQRRPPGNQSFLPPSPQYNPTSFLSLLGRRETTRPSIPSRGASGTGWAALRPQRPPVRYLYYVPKYCTRKSSVLLMCAIVSLSPSRSNSERLDHTMMTPVSVSVVFVSYVGRSKLDDLRTRWHWTSSRGQVQRIPCFRRGPTDEPHSPCDVRFTSGYSVAK